MGSWIDALLGFEDFPARWLCGNWTNLHGWLHIASDLAIWLAYMTIPVILIHFIRKRQDIPFNRLFWLFAGFIFSCGTGHLVESLIFWIPVYRLSAAVKIATALVSWLTVLALLPVIPKALELPSLAALGARLQQEIAERKKAAAQSRHLAATVESSNDAIITGDLEGRITSWNAAAERLWGRSRSAALGQALHSILPNDRHAELDEARARLARGAGRDPFETKGLGLAGELIDISLMLSPINDEAGRIVGISAFARDIRERKRLDEELERSNAELESFSYSVSHDLRAPLRHITGFASILKQQAGDSLDTESHASLETIIGSARHMGQLVDELLEFSRTGRSELDKTTIAVAELIPAILEELAPATEERETTWIIGDLPSVEADRTMLRQLLLNLLSNAIKYSSRVAQPTVEIGTHDSDDSAVTLFVRDNGVGFDMRYADKLFGVFQRLHSSSEFPGTGIGLANVRRIVQRHGGRVWADSAPDAGATFFVSFPRSKAEPRT